MQRSEGAKDGGHTSFAPLATLRLRSGHAWREIYLRSIRMGADETEKSANIRPIGVIRGESKVLA